MLSLIEGNKIMMKIDAIDSQLVLGYLLLLLLLLLKHYENISLFSMFPVSRDYLKDSLQYIVLDILTHHAYITRYNQMNTGAVSLT